MGGTHFSGDHTLTGDIEQAIQSYLDNIYVSKSYLASHPPATEDQFSSTQSDLDGAAAQYKKQDDAISSEILNMKMKDQDKLNDNDAALAAQQSYVDWYCQVANNTEYVIPEVQVCSGFSSQETCEEGNDCSWDSASRKCLPTNIHSYCRDQRCEFPDSTYMRGDIIGKGPLVVRRLHSIFDGSTCNIKYNQPQTCKSCTQMKDCVVQCTECSDPKGSSAKNDATLDLIQCLSPGATSAPHKCPDNKDENCCVGSDVRSITNCVSYDVSPQILSLPLPGTLQLKYKGDRLVCPGGLYQTVPPCNIDPPHSSHAPYTLPPTPAPSSPSPAPSSASPSPAPSSASY